MKPFHLAGLVALSLTFTPPCFPQSETAEDTTAEAVIELKKMSESEAAAVEKFKTDLNEIHAWLTEEIWIEDNAEARAHRLPIKMNEKLAGVSTEDLPADLVEAFDAYKAVFQKQADHVKGMPEGFAEIMEFMAKKFEDEAFSEAQTALFEAQFEAESTFIEVASGYGAGTEADLYRSDEEIIELKEMTEKEAAAVEKFKTDLNEIHAWLPDELWVEENAEARAHRFPIKLSEKLAGVSTEGLPADLAEAFGAYKVAVQKQADHVKGLPEDFAEIMEFMAKKFEDEAFTEAQSALFEAQYEAESAFIKIAASYGAGTEADLHRVEEKVIELKEMTKKESAAVEIFKAGLTEIHAWLAEEIFVEDNAEARSHRLPITMSTKLAAVPTEGLPADLIEAFTAYKAIVQKQADLVKGMPKDFAEIMEFMAKKFEDEAFSEAQSALFDAQFEAEADFIHVASSYGAGMEADLYRSVDGEGDAP